MVFAPKTKGYPLTVYDIDSAATERSPVPGFYFALDAPF